MPHPPAPRLSRPLSLREAAALLGPPDEAAARRLKRYLLAKEKQTRRRLLVRTGGEVQPRYRVTEAVLREQCPELFSRRDRVADTLRTYVADLREKLEELYQRDEVIAGQVGALARAMATVS